jgi:hypothetical protein
MKIIVARYNENIEWTNQLPNVIIYNKGVSLNNKNINEIMMKNVGREGHTYHKYIYDNYDNLDDYTVFLQGNPFDHSPNVITNLVKYINDENLQLDFEYLSERIVTCNLTGDELHKGIPLIAVYEKVFGEKKTEMPIVFGGGAQFIVSRERILKRPRDFYLNIVKLLEYSVSPIEGFVIERFQKLIFS